MRVRTAEGCTVCPAVYSTIAGDVVVAAAYSHELPKYGLSCGLTNYAATYCVGLLVARRVLTKLGLADTYKVMMCCGVLRCQPAAHVPPWHEAMCMLLLGWHVVAACQGHGGAVIVLATTCVKPCMKSAWGDQALALPWRFRR